MTHDTKGYTRKGRTIHYIDTHIFITSRNYNDGLIYTFKPERDS